jgi:two-component system, chemotaxis family, protein-glutamate methylesterase/glutaminase
MIKVLVVEDSSVSRELLVNILSSDPDILVTGAVNSGHDAIEEIHRNKPDIVTMDIHMLGMDGFEATRIIMETNPVPIIIVTGSSDMKELETSFRAIDAGALAVLKKPNGIGHPEYAADAKELISIVKLMSEIKVVRRWVKKTLYSGKVIPDMVPPPSKIRVVAIGASTGGPPVIQKILSDLPGNFPVPILIVQHIARGFTYGFAEWLNQTSSLPVHVASNGILILPGHVYIAPDGVQMKIAMEGEKNGRLLCAGDETINGLCPSISYLFLSVAESFGKDAIGILLTGMGKDGAMELKLMKEKGAVTIVQDEESSVVFGMPGEAIKLDAARYVLPPEKIATVLTSLIRSKV